MKSHRTLPRVPIAALWIGAIGLVVGSPGLTAGAAVAKKKGKGGKAALTTAYFPLEGTASAGQKKRITAALKAGLAAVGRKPIASSVPFEESASVVGCDPGSPECWRAVAGTLKADELVFGTLDVLVASEPAPAAAPEESAAKKPAATKGKGKSGGKGKAAAKGKGRAAPAPSLRLDLRIVNALGGEVFAGGIDLPGGKTTPKATTATIKKILAVAVDASHGVLVVKSEPPGATVIIDGKKRGETPVEVELRVGGHTVDLLMGAWERTRSVAVTADGGEVFVDLTAEDPDLASTHDDEPPEHGATEPKKPRKPKTGKKLRLEKIGLPAVAAAGGGVALLAVGVAFAVVTSQTHRRFEDRVAALDGPPAESDLPELGEIDSMGKRGKAFAALANVFVVVGGVALAAGAGLTVFDMTRGDGKTGDEGDAAPAVDEPATRLRARPAVVSAGETLGMGMVLEW